MAKSVPAIFLDRDGTINVDHGYVHEIDSFEFIDGVIDADARAKKKWAMRLVVVTNQSGIARGKFTEAQFENLNRMDGLVVGGSRCRFGRHLLLSSPSAGLYRRASVRHVIAASRIQECFSLRVISCISIMAASYMVGDKLEDMQAAAEANVGTKVLVRTGKPVTAAAENAADWVLNSLADLPSAIKKQQK
ncbi:D-glycero-D-manno-heptose 17-bisphosphate phosphatase [Salmonella enterica subsp. arizonae]|uniref:D,D-heptose 1,7-bisphosphate phosphatase n=1 Tax=Salmonella enterica subsp. arizonae TaxID=59203 RepID=A0A379TG63_SALER|nr:D-glycero-D-manno-heptose 17-bisphosphate phosphatase [Salmonella enterica subsp. arizonae]